MSNINSIKFIDDGQTYDLGVDHKDHQFYLSNGVLTSNSHAILYSMISFQTAYLKAHFPVEFLLANLMSEIRSGAKVAKTNIEKIKLELRNRGIKITPPDINKSSMTYEIQSDGSLLTGLEALKSIGQEAIEDIITKRPFKSFHDLMLRVDTKQVRSTVIQSLASSGCLDSLPANKPNDSPIPRKLIYLYCSDYRKKLQVWLKKHTPDEEFNYPWPEEKNWSKPEIYALEKFYLGESFTCNKSQAYKPFFDKQSFLVKDILQMHDREPIHAMRAEVKSIFEFKVKKETSKFLGQSMAKATIEDQNGEQITLTLFPTKWKEVKTKLRDAYSSKYKFDDGLAIHFSGTVNEFDDQIGVVLENFFSAQPSPSLPKDLKAKKVVVKRTAKSNDIVGISDTDLLIDSIEDQLFDEGLIDLDQEELDW